MTALAEKKKLRSELDDIYDNYRTACMNCKYYAKRLSTISRFNNFYEATLALGASSTIAGWSIWQDPTGRMVWTVFAGVVAILVVIKPFFQLPKKIEQYSKLHTGYKGLYYDYKQLVKEIKKQEILTDEMKQILSTAEKRYKDLANEDVINPSRRLILKCQDQVNQEVPVESLWYPQ